MNVVKRRFTARFMLTAGLVGIGMIVPALVFAVAARTGTAGSGNILKMSVVPTTKGPLTSCSADPCGPETTLRAFLYVENKNPLPPNWDRDTQYTRATLPGAFVMSSVDVTIFVNGQVYFATTNYPPPGALNSRRNAGHWPSTVTCPDSPSDPCNVVGSPAILPGEKTVALWERWTHASGEPNGAYVFRFTIHGTLDGAPVDLTADSPSILMTD
jgi:hypothetical protein